MKKLGNRIFRIARFTAVAASLVQVASSEAGTLAGSNTIVHACDLSNGGLSIDPSTVGNPSMQSLICWYPNPPGGGSQNSFGVVSALANKPTQTTTTSSKPTPACGSIINVGLQALAEEIPLVGTGLKLRYDSNRMWGFGAKRTIKKVLSTTTTPALSGATVTFGVAGQTNATTYSAFSPNMQQSYTWDGLDSSGLMVGGSACVTVKTDETPSVQNCDADGLHCDFPAPIGRSDGLGCNTDVNFGSQFLGGWDPKALGLGGWTLSNVHHYDIVRGTIETGSGQSISATASPSGSNYRVGMTDSNEIYIFNAAGWHLQTLNSLTGSVKLTMAYVGNGRLSTVTDAYGRVLTVTYDGTNRATQITGPFGHVTLLNVATNGYLTKVTAPDTTFHQMTYYGNEGLLASFQKPLGQVSTFSYDALGQLTQDAGVEGFVSNLTRSTPLVGTDRMDLTSGEGVLSRNEITYSNILDNHTTNQYLSPVNQTQITETSNNRTTNQFWRYSLSETFANDPRFGASQKYTSAYTYSKTSGGSLATTVSKSVSYVSGTGPFNVNTLSTFTVVGGQTYQEIYNGPANTLQYISPLSRTTLVALNAQERPTSYQFADLTPTTFTYNTDGKLARLDQGVRNVVYTYNTKGLVASVKNALNETTSFTYDANDRLLKTTFPDTNFINYTWDANGNLTSVKPPTRTAHGFGFTLSDKVGSYDPPALTGIVSTAYQYDLDRRLKKITRPNSDQINLSYTDYKLSLVSTPLGNYTYTYDTGLNDLLRAVVSPDSVTTTITRSDEFITRETMSGAGLGRIAYSYDANLRPSTINIQDSGGTVLSAMTYTYNNDSEVTAAQDLTLTRHATRSYVTGLTLGSVTETIGYNTFGELTSQAANFGATSLYTSTLTRDNLGRVKTNAEKIGGVTTNYGYTYNKVGRLTAVTKGGAAYSTYVYDANGNRTSRKISGVTVTATTDAQDRLLTQGTLSFTYNQNGEMLTKADSATATTTGYVWDSMGNLKRVNLPGGVNYVEYLMDGFNRRHVRKQNGVVDRYFVYQNQLQIAAELSSTGALIARYVYGSRQNVPEYMVKAAVNYRIISDQLGSVRLVVRASDGVIMQRMDYDEFGRVTNDTSPGFQPFGFAGGLYDGSSKLTHFGAREYDADTGRWLSKDPILFGGGDTNLYGYVLNDPINWTDASGLNRDSTTGPVKEENLGPGNGYGNGGGGRGPFTPDQRALVELARQAFRQGVTRSEARTLLDWAREVNLRGRNTIDQPHAEPINFEHMHLGPVNHIPICD